jgi:F0F1-type ATP synthase assembly protein I
MVADRPPDGPRTSIGLMVMGSEMAGFAVLGLLLDFGLGTMPGFTIGLTLLGFVVVFVHLVRFSRAMANRPGPPPLSEGPR